MRFEWDEAKRLSNLHRHGIDFSVVESEGLFANETVTQLDDRFDYGEERWVTLALLKGEVVTIIHTETDEVIRLISVRKALKSEENIYFKEIRN